jgi:hypothetical protein
MNFSATELIGGVIIAGLIVFYAWVYWPWSKWKPPIPAQNANEAHMIGLITGALGGSVADAATARYALKRFEEQHGRPATRTELAQVLLIARALSSSFTSGE